MQPYSEDFVKGDRIPDAVRAAVMRILGLPDVSDAELAAGMAVVMQHRGVRVSGEHRDQPAAAKASSASVATIGNDPRSAELEQRESWVWQQMQHLLERERALIAQERLRFEERERALTAQLGVLQQLVLTQLSHTPAPPSLPSQPPPPPAVRAAAGAPPSEAAQRALVNELPSDRIAQIVRALEEERAHDASGRHGPHGTFDEQRADAATAAVVRDADSALAGGARPSVAEQVLGAMRMVAGGADVLADLDFSAATGGRGAAPASAQVQAPASPPAPAAAPAEVQAPAGGAATPVETMLAPPEGPPPLLTVGADDIYWVGTLQTKLDDAGYYCGEDDVNDIMFGTGTQSAVLTFQACEGLTETGTADAATWSKLLGRPVTLFDSGSTDAAATPPPAANGAAFGGLFSGASAQGAAATAAQGGKSEEVFTTWPVLLEGDGGRAVHSMQVKLRDAGYHCDDDEAQWWMFGMTTQAALRTFQSCNSLPESGACDEKTWLALMPPGSTPADISRVVSGGSDDDDLADSGEGRVWLLGEQRWSRV